MMNREKQKKEQKTFEYIENPEQIEGFDKIPVPEDLDQRVRAGIEEGKKRRKKIAFRKTAKVGMGMAAAVALASVLCISNPSFAAKMPLIGHIFEQVENNTSVKGDFSQVAETLTQSTEMQTAKMATQELMMIRKSRQMEPIQRHPMALL